MTKWNRFWKNLKVLAHALATEKSIVITPKPTLTKRQVSAIVLAAIRKEVKPLLVEITESLKQRAVTKIIKNNGTPEIQWPEGETTWEQLCQANVNFSKEELRKALGQKMEQHRKVLI